MDRYEYRVVLKESIDNLISYSDEESEERVRQQFEGWLNLYGEQGWALVTVSQKVFVFKRRLPDEAFIAEADERPKV